MSQIMPVKDFEWFSEGALKKLTSNNIQKIKDDAKKGLILEVDLEYPKSLKERTKYLPFCPERKAIEFEQLSEYQQTLVSEARSGEH